MLAVLAAAPSARASTTAEIAPDYDRAEVSTTTSTDPYPTHRNDPRAEGHASVNGALDVQVSIESKVAGYLPFVAGGNAFASSTIVQSDDLPAGTKYARYLAHFVIDDASASTTGRDGLSYNGNPFASLSLEARTPLGYCCQLGFYSTIGDRAVAFPDDVSAPGSRADVAIEVWNYYDEALPPTIEIHATLNAEAHARLLKGSAAASAQVRLVGLSAEYSDSVPRNGE